jgi:hypothetical protein
MGSTMGASINPLRNGRNDASVSHQIKEYFYKYPNSTARECCRALRLDYSKCGGRARKIKHDFKRWKGSIVTVTDQHGRLLNPLTSVHRLEFGLKEPVPASYVAVLEEKACTGRVKGAWYRSPNRNRQLEYFDDRISVRVYPKSGTCRIFPRNITGFEDVRACVEDTFAKVLPTSAILSDSFKHMIDGLQPARRHRTFPVGPITPFKVDFYRDPLGLTILADRSHPEHLEVVETWPTWVAPLFELQRETTVALQEFATQIRSHLHVMQGIGSAVDRLNETIDRLNTFLRLRPK